MLLYLRRPRRKPKTWVIWNGFYSFDIRVQQLTFEMFRKTSARKFWTTKTLCKTSTFEFHIHKILMSIGKKKKKLLEGFLFNKIVIVYMSSF
jgi:hypothetical protein